MARRPELLLVIVFSLALSVCVRVYMLGHANYWLDEMVSLHFAKHADWKSIFWDNNPPFFHLLLRMWVAVFNDTEVTTRTLSVVFSVAATGVMLRIGHELRGFIGALLFGTFHALWIVSVIYARETRMYALFELFSALNLLYFMRLMKRGVGIRAYALSAALMSLSHYLAVVPLGVQAALLTYKNRGSRKTLLLSLGAMALALVVLTISYFNFFQWDALMWQQLKFSIEEDSRWPVTVVVALLNYSSISVIGSIAIVALAVWITWRQEGHKNFERAILAVMIAVPIALLFAFGLITARSVSLPRYWIYLVPPIVTLIGCSFADLWEATGLKNIVRQGAFALLLGMVLVGTTLSAPEVYLNRKEPWKSVADMIGDYPNSLVLTSRTIAVKTPYFDRLGIEVDRWSPWTEEGTGKLRKAINEGRRVWIVENYYGAYYFSSMLVKLQKQFKFTDVSVSVDHSAPVRVVLVEKIEKRKKK